MERTARRWVGRLVRVGLVLLAFAFVGAWLWRKVPAHGRMSVQREPVAEEPLAPGDLRIFSTDGAVELVLRDDQILAGLSPQMVAKVRSDMERSSAKDTSGIGGLIASTVKRSVAGAIGTHVVYPVSDVREITYEDGRLVLRTSNGRVRLFSNTHVNGSDRPELFAPDDAQRFVEAVRARMRDLKVP